MPQSTICVFLLLVLLRKRKAQDARTRTLRRLRELRDKNNAFVLPENTFRRKYRFPRALAKDLVDELSPFDEGIEEDIPFYIRVLSTLYFYANGSFQGVVGDCNTLNTSQSSVSRNLSKITNLIVQHLARKYISFPSTDEGKNIVQRGFLDKFGVPNILGTLDCTHVAISKPWSSDIEHHPRHYRNRKKYYSINVEACCTSDLIFTSVNARYPGAVHDSSIWVMSPVREYLQQNFDLNNPLFLLADCGYPTEPWLLTPYIEPHEDFQSFYNMKHKQARKCIEQAFGVLKGSFKCLSKTRTLYYHPTKAGNIIYGCVILYNFLKLNNFPLNDVEDLEDQSVEFAIEEDEDLLQMARNIRNDYAQTLHPRLHQ
ncbi:putative nuclease HARBI1 [Phlebotomus papatasi]|uniref:putative nuclease HARBI1 n=1 Tax=Phlebotomus papatasi TaxID=29031 RepID=UPI002483E294|nr:putative nuclease HARBI1 [Phlebotomus papatasi]